jgi:energy-coupling factor transport system substrate-specific component
MLGAAWFGLGAGLLPAARGRAEIALLAAYGSVAALLYGALMN